MSTQIKNRPAADDYFRLVRTFPLRVIRIESEYQRAGKMLNRLLGRPGGKLSTGERDYVEALSLFVEDYDRKHSEIGLMKRTPHDALRYLAKEAGMGPTALSKVLGATHAMASLLLHGKRGISAESARVLGEYFKVDAGLFV